MAAARTMDDVVRILRDSAREIAGAEGIAVVLREGDECLYLAEDAMAPLWQGQRFSATTCISGWAMMRGRTAAIADVFDDDRIPHEAYRATFVRSLVMAPIGVEEPVAALGAYWAAVRQPDAAVILRIEALARAAAIAIENIRFETRLRALAADILPPKTFERALRFGRPMRNAGLFQRRDLYRVSRDGDATRRD